MIGLSQAFDIVVQKITPRKLDVETVQLNDGDAIGRVVSEDILSPIDLPPFDKSAMDGYAIPDGEFLDSYEVDATIPAGSSHDKPIEPGHCVKVMTGAPVPPGTARVVMWEATEESTGHVRIIRKSEKSNICRVGEDLRKGEILCPRGTILTPLVLANIALGGVPEIKVSKRPDVAVFSTGDELLPAGEEIKPGKIYDSNGPMLLALLKDAGFPVTTAGHIPDDLDISVSSLGAALSTADVVILTGAVSKGDYDYLPEAFRRCGLEIHFDELAVKPGKPTTFATSRDTGDKYVFGLPGNPVSSFIMFHLFVLPALYIMQGCKLHPRVIKCPLKEEIKSRKNERDQFIPVKIDRNGAAVRIEYHGSGHLTALADADGFVEIESGVTSIHAGEMVSFMPFMMKAYLGSEM